MFTTPCFINKNSKELRHNLEELGYNICKCAKSKTAEGLYCNDTVGMEYNVHGRINYDKGSEPFADKLIREHSVDCGTNKELFLAMAALRDDSDKNQWFTIDREHMYNKEDNPQEGIYWYLCDVDDYRISDGLSHDQGWHEWHKAAVKELIEHFKNK